MSIADKIFVDNLKDILSNGAWDTDSTSDRIGQTVKKRIP